MTNFVYDTLYRRARRGLIARLHEMDDRLARMRGGKKRLLFEAVSPMSFVVFRPVYDRLRRDPRLEFYFTATGATWEPGALFASVGIADHVIAARDAAWLKVDACINTDFWDMTWLNRCTRRLHLFHGVAGKYGLDAPVDLAPDVAIFDRIMFPNRDRLDRYLEAGLVTEETGVPVLVGYPKIDCLVDGTLARHAIAARLRLEPGIPTVLYAPTWSPYSSLTGIGEELVGALARADFNVLVKLHDRSYDRSSRGSGGVDWAARLAPLADHPRVRVITDADAAPYLFVADALITDHSSIGFEYAVLDRPLIVIDCPELIANARVNPQKAALLQAAAEVRRTIPDLVRAVAEHLEHPQWHAGDRQRIAVDLFYRPGTAAARAAATVYDALEIEAPAAQPEAVHQGVAAITS